MDMRAVLSRSLLGLLLCTACGDDNGRDSDTDASTNPTAGTVGPTTAPTTSAETAAETDDTTGPGSDTDSSGGETSPTTGEPTTGEPTGEPTTSSTTDDPTDDPTTGGGDGMYCIESCEQDADCSINGENQGYTCGADNLCTSDAGQCATDEECRILYSGWEFGDNCAAQGDCAVTQGCINLDGVGKCVYIPSDFLSCEDINQEEIPMPAIEGGTITVCGNTTAICTEDKYCLDGCSTNADCLAPAYPVCNTDTKRCECGTDADCANNQPGASVCLDGYCQCATDNDCAELDYADRCYDGACGCSQDQVCDGYTQAFDGTSVSCRGI